MDGQAGPKPEFGPAETLAGLIYSENAVGNIERALEFLAQHDPSVAAHAVEAIRDGIETLREHPFIGRRIEGDMRDLVISFGRTGHVALYRYLPGQDWVRILAVRHQREIGYRE